MSLFVTTLAAKDDWSQNECIRAQVEKAEHDAELLNKLSKDGKAFLKGYVNKARTSG